MLTRSRLRVFVDADVIFAGSASPSQHSASLVTLRVGEITLIDAVTSRQAIAEAERNLAATIPDAVATFRLLADRSLRVVANPSRHDLEAYGEIADPKDLPILVAAVRERCRWLVTFNADDLAPAHPDVTVLRPGGLRSASAHRPDPLGREPVNAVHREGVDVDGQPASLQGGCAGLPCQRGSSRSAHRLARPTGHAERGRGARTGGRAQQA